MTTPHPRHPDSPTPHPGAEDLVAFCDGALAEADAARVSSHVAACADCAREADLLRRSAALVERLPGLRASEGFAERLAARAATRSGGRLLALPRMRAAIAAAAVLVAVGVGYVATRPTEDELLARDLLLLANLDVLEAGDAAALARLADDLDVVEQVRLDDDAVAMR